MESKVNSQEFGSSNTPTVSKGRAFNHSLTLATSTANSPDTHSPSFESVKDGGEGLSPSKSVSAHTPSPSNFRKYECLSCGGILTTVWGDEPKCSWCKSKKMRWINTEVTAKEEAAYKREVKYQFINCAYGKNKDWATASELLTDYVMKLLKIYTTKDDLKSEMWVYKEGIYVPQGKSEIKEILRDLLGEHYSIFVLNKVIEKIEPDTFIEADKFFINENINELPVENGILNIMTGEILPFNPKKIFFNKLPVKYDPSATCPKIDEFLRSVLANEEDIKVYYEMVGSALWKEYIFEKAFMFVGGGRNGKGKSIELVKRLIGMENTCSVPLNSLFPESFAVSELFGKMINLAGDIGNQDLKDTSMFKAATGRDILGGKRKFQRNINFKNYAKFIFACNDLPMVYDLSRGFWERWILLKYPYTFVSQAEFDAAKDKTNLKIQDPQIIDKISTPEEMSGLLNEAIIGFHRALQNKKFSATMGCEDVKATWIRKSNSFVAFCFDCLEEAPEGYIVKKELRKKYSDYMKEHKVKAVSDFKIKQALQDMFGASEGRKSIGFDIEHIWEGIRWKK